MLVTDRGDGCGASPSLGDWSNHDHEQCTQEGGPRLSARASRNQFPRRNEGCRHTDSRNPRRRRSFTGNCREPLDVLGGGAAPALPLEASASKPSIVSNEVWFAAALPGSEAIIRKALRDGRSKLPLELRLTLIEQTMADAAINDLNRDIGKTPRSRNRQPHCRVRPPPTPDLSGAGDMTHPHTAETTSPHPVTQCGAHRRGDSSPKSAPSPRG